MENLKDLEQELEVDELDDFDEIQNVSYEVCLIGYNENQDVTDFEYQIFETNSLLEARSCFNYFDSTKDILTIKNKDDKFYIPADVKYINVILQTQIEDEAEIYDEKQINIMGE